MKRILTLTLIFAFISGGAVFFASCACANTSDLATTSFRSDCCAQMPACHSYFTQTACTFLDLAPIQTSDFKTPISLSFSLAKEENLLSLSTVQAFHVIDTSGFVPSKENTYLLNSTLLI